MMSAPPLATTEGSVAPAAPVAAAAPAAPPARLSRHLVAAAVATAVDFAVMGLLVELGGLGAAPATLVGALLGAATNFGLGRAWVYRATSPEDRPLGDQAARYGAVAATSAALNALGEHAALAVAGSHYVAARAVVALAVSVLWNYPMQRRVVFARDA